MIALETPEREPETATLADISRHGIVQPLQALEKPQTDGELLEKAESLADESTGNAPKPVEYRMFVAWLALPTQFRKPPTLSALAKVLKVSRPTLWRWQQKGAALEAAKIADLTLIARHGEIMQALGDKAASGDVQAVRTYLEYVLRRGAPARVEVNTSGPTQVNFVDVVRETEKVDALPGWLTESVETENES